MPRILIFDDDTDILELCSIILGSKGFETIAKPDSKSVIEEIIEAAPDVILMDNWIPGIGGVKATQLIKGHPDTGTIPVIFFSANNNIEDLAKEAQADYYLKKPFDITELSSIVANALGKTNGTR